MISNRSVFERSVHTAEEWLNSIARAFDTDDHRFAYRVLRAWLHGLRDELPVAVCAHFAAQLPELWRGIYYEGWNPAHVPADHDVESFIRRFSQEAQVRPGEVHHVASTVTAGIRRQLPGTALATVMEHLPQPLREVLWTAPVPAAANIGDPLAELRAEVRTLSEAVTELVHGLEGTPVQEVHGNASEAAHRAHQILLSGRR